MIDYSINDLARRRFSAVDYFNMKFGKCTTSRLRDILNNHEQFVPKCGRRAESMSRTLAQRKKAVIELIGKNLQKEFESSLTELLRNCLKHRNEAVREETMTGMLCQLFESKRRNNEPILEETD